MRLSHRPNHRDSSAAGRMSGAVLLSLLLHAMLLALQFGVPSLGMPGWQAVSLEIELAGALPDAVPAASEALQATIGQARSIPPLAPTPEIGKPGVRGGFMLVDPVPKARQPMIATPSRAPKNAWSRQTAPARTPPSRARRADRPPRVIALDPLGDTFLIPVPERDLIAQRGDGERDVAGSPGDEDRSTVPADVLPAEAAAAEAVPASVAAADDEAAMLAATGQEKRAQQALQASQIAGEEQRRRELAQREQQAAQQQREQQSAQKLAQEQAAGERARTLLAQRLANEQADAARESEIKRRAAQQVAERELSAQQERQRLEQQRDTALHAGQLAEQADAEQRRLKQEQLQQKALELAAQQRAEETAMREKILQQKADQERVRQQAQQLEQQQAAEAERMQAEQLARRREEELAARRQEEELAARRQAGQARAQRLEEERAARKQAAERSAEQAEQQAVRDAAEQATARQRQHAEALPAGAGETAGQSGPGGSGGASKKSPGIDLGGRAGDFVKGIDLLRGAPPVPHEEPEDKGRRRVLVAAGERDVPLRMYVDSWRQKVERNGNMNYSRLSREMARNDPVVTVAIRSDGSVEDITIVRSSGRADLDEAVRRIVRVNARYAMFPPKIAAAYDVIEIRRAWNFDETLKIVEESR